MPCRVRVGVLADAHTVGHQNTEASPIPMISALVTAPSMACHAGISYRQHHERINGGVFPLTDQYLLLAT